MFSNLSKTEIIIFVTFNLVWSKILSCGNWLREFADNNFKFDENDGKFSKRVENTV